MTSLFTAGWLGCFTDAVVSYNAMLCFTSLGFMTTSHLGDCKYENVGYGLWLCTAHPPSIQPVVSIWVGNQVTSPTPPSQIQSQISLGVGLMFIFPL